MLIVTFSSTTYQIPALVLCILLIGAIAGCLYLFNDQLRAQREHLQRQHLEAMLQDQLEHYAALYQTNQQLAGLRHDLKNILINVRSYIQLKEYEKLDAYMEQLQEQIQPASLVDNGLPFIDAVLTAKVAGHEEIDFSWHIDPLNLKYIQQSQLAMVLAIALDNALDACAVSRAPFIDIRIAQQGDLISLVVTNAADHPVNRSAANFSAPSRTSRGTAMECRAWNISPRKTTAHCCGTTKTGNSGCLSSCRISPRTAIDIGAPPLNEGMLSLCSRNPMTEHMKIQGGCVCTS